MIRVLWRQRVIQGEDSVGGIKECWELEEFPWRATDSGGRRWGTEGTFSGDVGELRDVRMAGGDVIGIWWIGQGNLISLLVGSLTKNCPMQVSTVLDQRGV